MTNKYNFLKFQTNSNMYKSYIYTTNSTYKTTHKQTTYTIPKCQKN